MVGIARENHYVPRGLLRHWSIDGTRVYAYRLLVSACSVPEWTLKPLRSSLRLTNLYTRVEHGNELDTFERWIDREFENAGLGAVDRLVSGARLAPSDWLSVARLVAMQDVRTPLSLIESKARWAEEMPSVFSKTVRDAQEVLKSGRIPPEDRSDRNSFERSLRVTLEPATRGQERGALVRLTVSSERALWVDTMRHLLTSATNALTRHRWSVGEAFGDSEWPMTDHPVLRLNFYEPGHYDFRGGWDNPGSEILMPISPRHLLYVQVGRERRSRFQFTEDQTIQLQRFLVERAHRWVFARRPMSWVAEVRPRVVDREAFQKEEKAWMHWHELQADSERDFDCDVES